MFTKINHNGTAWKLREGFDEKLADSLLHTLTKNTPPPGFSLIRDNNIRSSFLAKTGASLPSEVFIKRYKCRGLHDAVKYILVPSKAVSEWRSFIKFEKHNLPCPKVFACGEQRSFGILKDSCLITESLAPAIPLNEYVLTLQSVPHRKREIARALALLINRLHTCNIYYRDLHAGNILVSRAAAGPPELFLIDLHRAFVLPVLLPWMRVNDLAQLCNSLPASRTGGLQFLKTYCTAGNMSHSTFRALQGKITDRQARLEKQRIRSRSKRCLKNSTIFEKETTWDERYFGRRDFGRHSAHTAVTLHRAQMTTHALGAIKKSSKSAVTVHSLEADSPLCVKGYRYLGMLYSAKNIFRRSRALKSWIAANSLLVRNICTPLPLAVIENRYGPVIRESFLITRWLPHVTELNQYIQAATLLRRKDAFLQSLAKTMRDIHDKGVYHADLKSNNILVAENGAEGWTFYFVDLDRVHFKQKLSFYERANNLAQINASVASIMTAKDRLKFFHFYAKGTSSFSERKKYYRTILKISRTKNTAPYGIIFYRDRMAS